MNCSKVRSYLALYIDSELGPEMTFEIARHLESCATCRTLAKREAGLESGMRAHLTRVHPSDETLWERALRSAVKPPRFSARAMSLAVVGSLVVVLGAGWLIMNPPGERHELDLAAAAYSQHVQCLASRSTPPSPAVNMDSIEQYFRLNLSPAFKLPGGVDSTISLGAADFCQMGGVRMAHLVYQCRQSMLSVFWMEGRFLARFPDASARLSGATPSLHCRVSGNNFYVKASQQAVICALGIADGSVIEELVEAFSRESVALEPSPLTLRPGS